MKRFNKKWRFPGPLLAATAAVATLVGFAGCTLDRLTTINGADALTAEPEETLTVPGPNVMQVVVNGDGTSCGFPNNETINMPCVSVTICAPGTGNCQTIPNILLDTGSWGLRIFKNTNAMTPLITVPLTPAPGGASGATLSECVTYLGSNTQWGPVMLADVQLGQEPVISQLPIHVLDASAPGADANCSTVDPSTNESVTPTVDAEDAGFNGILGVGLNVQDCGAACVGPDLNASNDPMYYSCTGSSCSPIAVPLANQVTNPAAALASDNNGVILELPAVPPAGVHKATGALVFGIGTETNNQPGAFSTYQADTSSDEFGGRIQTVFSPFSANPIPGFLDSGSSLISFPANSGTNTITDCGTTDTHYAGLFCPAQSLPLSATNTGDGGTPDTIDFTIQNALTLIDGGNIVFSDMASNAFPVNPNTLQVSASTGYFDWGLPFFLGRSVAIGFAGAQSSLGTGPYWAFHD